MDAAGEEPRGQQRARGYHRPPRLRGHFFGSHSDAVDTVSDTQFELLSHAKVMFESLWMFCTADAMVADDDVQDAPAPFAFVAKQKTAGPPAVTIVTSHPMNWLASVLLRAVPSAPPAVRVELLMTTA
jgi:hypothetical protein